MDRRTVWPDWRREWVIHLDDDLVVIDKPCGVSSQAADPSRPDDVVTRLSRFLADEGGPARAPAPGRGVSHVYLGVLQRLDKETSGVMVLARHPQASARLAAQFEARGVRKTYVAGVTGWPKGKDRVVLRDALARGQDGRMEVRAGRAATGAGAKPAVTGVKVLARRGERALLELDLETGRTHQARVQLAHAGAPIAGDALYGGARAPRLMLHAGALSLEHPATGRRSTYAAKVPREVEDWLEHGEAGEAIYDDEEALRGALRRAVERRWGLGRAGAGGDEGARATTAFRLVHEDGDALPRLAVDAYGGWLVAQLYGEDGPWQDAARRERVLDALGALGFDGVYLKVRPKQANTLVDTRREDLAPRLPVRGVPAPDPLEVLEEGAPLLVRLGDGLSTGVFLDQRSNRARVREMAAGASVANLFAYTCGFTVAAALGGAARTVSVDVSAAALERGRANLERASILGDQHAFVAADVFSWLARAERRGERFDLVVLDPPSYSTTRRGRFAASSDYVDLAAAAVRVLSDGGRLLACTNHRGIPAARFRRILFDACRSAGREPLQVKDLPAQADFPVPAGAEPAMKSALVTLGKPGRRGERDQRGHPGDRRRRGGA
jgi:23S rRNA (cytosine1962-C5)-methyltransferase